jgi:ketosteroid isomerase-like protein
MPVPADSAASPEQNSGIAIELKAQEERWEESFASHDVSVTEQLVADDFVGTSSSGKVGNKSTMVSQAMHDKNVYTSAVSGDMIVHAFGPNVAVITGIAREAGKTPAGKAFSHTYRFTDTWMQRNDVWQCVAAHAMAMPTK